MSASKLSAFKETREIARGSFATVLSELLESEKNFSEVDLRDKWLVEIQKSGKVFDDGWYSPPPHGVGVLFASDNEEDLRTDYGTLRTEDKWPRDDVFFDREHGLMLVYASPIEKDSGVIGDFGMTVYVGKRPEVQEHLKAVFALTRAIYEHAQVGMTFAELTKFANTLFAERDFESNVVVTTGTSVDNLGHTIPSTEDDWSDDEKEAIYSGDPEARRDAISKKRIYVDVNEDHVIAPGIAFTIEPRPKVKSDSTIPMAFFHTVCIFNEDGKKEFVTNFDEIFKIAKMDYML